MKQSLILIAILGTIGFSSCKDGGKIFGNKKDSEMRILSLENENAELRQQLSEFEAKQQEEILMIRNDYEQKIGDLQQKIEAGKVKEYSGYFVVVGSFKNFKYAEEYAQKIQQMGYEGTIVDGPNSFHLVTSGTYKSLKSSIEAMNNARSVVASEAWVYFK